MERMSEQFGRKVFSFLLESAVWHQGASTLSNAITVEKYSLAMV